MPSPFAIVGGAVDQTAKTARDAVSLALWVAIAATGFFALRWGYRKYKQRAGSLASLRTAAPIPAQASRIDALYDRAAAAAAAMSFRRTANRSM